MFQDGLEKFDSAREISINLHKSTLLVKSHYVNYGSQNTELDESIVLDD